MLPHLTADEQRKLQATVEELAQAGEALIEYGDRVEFRALERRILEIASKPPKQPSCECGVSRRG